MLCSPVDSLLNAEGFDYSTNHPHPTETARSERSGRITHPATIRGGCGKTMFPEQNGAVFDFHVGGKEGSGVVLKTS